MNPRHPTAGASAAVQATPGSQLVSAKRTPLERRGIHAWHPYYAGYSEAFVESAISYLGIQEPAVILDPWGGSGTTGMVAARLGIPALCLDINPVMSTFAAAKSVAVVQFEEPIWNLLDDLSTKPPEGGESLRVENHPIGRRFAPETAKNIRALVEFIQSNAVIHSFQISPPREVLNTLVGNCRALNSGSAFLMSALFVTLRNIAAPQRLTNPTWVREPGAQLSVPYDKLVLALKTTCHKMMEDVRDFFTGDKSGALNHALVGDSREIPIKSDSIQYVITSPPYLTRIDYGVSTSPELALFGDAALTETIRHNTMGAPVITKQEKQQRTGWGTKCNVLLSAIAAHPTKAARGYYWKTIVQYFMDMEASLKQIHRVLRNDGQALVVVQSSYFKDVEMPLGEIYVEFAGNLGFVADIAFREEVRGHMAHVNTKSSVYAKNKVYFEDVVRLRKVRG